MEVLKFNRGKLMGMAIVCGLATVFFLMLFINPEAVAGTRKGRFFATGFGHNIFLPLLILVCASGCWRAAVLGMGNLIAIEATDTELVVQTMWGTKRLLFRDLVRVRVISVGSWPFDQDQLEFKMLGGLIGKKVRLPLMLTNIAPRGAPLLLEAINLLKSKAEALGYRGRAGVAADGFDPDAAIARYQAGKLGVGVGATPAPRPEPAASEAGDGFDPDAALARYFAKRDAGLIDPVGEPAPAPAMAPRPAFGRKGLSS